MPQAVRAYVGLGANIGEPLRALNLGIAALSALPGTRVVARSSIYRTAPVDAAGPDYLNAVVALDTELLAEALLQALHAIEMAQGRERPFPNAPRTLDLDLLLWGDVERRDAGLRLPHPRLHLRAFVLEPLAEIAPELQVPGIGSLAPWRERASVQSIERLASLH